MADKWKKIRKLGKGGNGTVYEVEDKSNNRFAMKVLDKVGFGKAYSRFKSEVEVLNNLKSQKGIVQIVDYYLPEQVSQDEKPYYVMPLGIPFKDYIEGKSNEELYTLIFTLCDTLQELHSQDITHRDIKPDNLLVINNQPVFSDFGLANFPKKEKVSEPKEKIGPKWTIAPEMERISSTAEFKKADIYSFAKTLWMLITKQWWGFEGQYIPNSTISIDKHIELMINKPHLAGIWYYHSIVLLNRLFSDATDNNPTNRPDAKSFNERLRYWYTSNDDYFERNPYEWEDALHKVFPVSIPNSSSWSKPEDIVRVLDIVSSQYDNLNHSFFPAGGGDDINHVGLSVEAGCITLDHTEIIKPKVLIFEFMDDLNWSYFRLELMPIERITTNAYSEDVEYLAIDELGNYSEREDGVKQPVTRYLKGSIVITKKTSMINELRGKLNAYSGYHNTMNNDGYKALLHRVREQINSLPKQS